MRHIIPKSLKCKSISTEFTISFSFRILWFWNMQPELLFHFACIVCYLSNFASPILDLTTLKWKCRVSYSCHEYNVETGVQFNKVTLLFLWHERKGWFVTIMADVNDNTKVEEFIAWKLCTMCGIFSLDEICLAVVDRCT